MLTMAAPSAVPVAGRSTLMDSVSQWLAWGGSRLAMPAGCQLQDFLATGVCTLQVQLGSLFGGKDVALRLVARRCGGSAAAVPEVYVDCVGADCGSVVQAYNYQLCMQDSDCGSGSVCRLFADYAVAGGRDPLASLLWHANANDICANQNTFAFNLTQLLSLLGGRGAVPAGPDSRNGICQPQLEQLRNFPGWLRANKYVNGSTSSSGAGAWNAGTYFAPLVSFAAQPGETLPTANSTLPCTLAPTLASPVYVAPPVAPVGSKAVDPNWQDLVVLDCTSTLHLLGSHPTLATDVSVSAPAITTVVYNFLKSAVLNRVRCHCPLLPAASLRRLFELSVESLLFAAQGGAGPLATALNTYCPDVKISFANFSSIFSAAWPSEY